MESLTCKYLWRYEHKGRAAEDLQKAKYYLDKLADALTEEEFT